ncbi:MAG: hypothetical protein B7Z42_08420 [Brevundimonas sp. 12-68-7]|uniref:Egg lysin n=1 Tax=Brevundimonas subvibrioides TaxID=74313 RepID=A0A258FLG5_9CAUL|nr:MAG: hypothetical protein B7Z42_08420 [Brevundimonas sp. 12-68-7]OYX32622.1 MAG: hypothetical protein B7Z01_10685 [Brevundimonas subvibrioides]
MRDRIVSEMHLRRLPPLTAPCRLAQVVRLVEPIDREEERRGVQDLAAATDESQVFERHARGALGGKEHWIWERHSEASTSTLITEGDGAPFDPEAHDARGRAWLEGSPGLVIRAVKIVVGADEAAVGAAVRALDPEEVISGRQGHARIWSDFKVHADGWGRFVVAAGGSHPADLGRLVQRVQELGNYRNMALLALPVVQAESSRLDRMEADLVGVSKRLTDTRNEEAMLDEISRLGAEVADLTAATAFRLGAMKAYAGIVSDRLRDLACAPVEGYQPLDDFIDRRLTPATRTCLAFADRLEALATRLERATALLRTRIELRVQAQNTALLASVEQTASRQLKLQHLVEGLSVVAVSYYALGILAYVIKPSATRLGMSPDLAQAVALPVVVGLVWLYLLLKMRRLDHAPAARFMRKP